MRQQRPGRKVFKSPGASFGVKVIQPAAAAGFVPSDIPNLDLWLRADLGTFQDVLMTVPAILDGDPIGGWQDQSGSGNHATNAININQPDLRLNVINGMPVVRFVVANGDWLDILTGAALGITDTVTVFFAMIPNNIGARMTMIGQYNLANAFQTETTAAGQKGTLMPGVWVSRTNAMFLGAWEVLTYRRAGPGAGTHTWRRNGVNLALVVDNPQAYAANGVKAVGRRQVGSQHFDGDFAEILVYTTNLTDGQIALVEGWLNGRYAIF